MTTTDFTRKVGYALGILSLLSLSACLTEKTDGEGGDVSAEISATVLSITPPQGEEAGTIITRSSEYDCDGTTLITMTYNDTSRYVIDDGTLYLWYDGQCYVDITLSGSSSTITGTWTADSLSAFVLVPEAYRPEDCETDEEIEGDESLSEIFRNATATYTISETSISANVTGTLCYTPLFAELFAAIGGGIEVTASSCGSATLTDTVANKTATVSSIHQDGMIVTTFSHGDSVCTMSEYFDFSNEPPVCSEESQGGDEAFFNCMIGSGFYGSFEEPLDTDTTMTEKRATNGSASNPAAAVREALRKAAARLP